MKRGIIILVLIFIILIGIMTIDFTKEEEGLEGELAESKQQQNLSIVVLPPTPLLTIISPENITYSSTSILLNYSVTNADAVWYNLDNGENITINSSMYLTASEGSHILYLYANNSNGTTIKNISFSVHVSSPGTNGNGGNGGNGIRPGNGVIIENETCQESWVCGDWTECINSSQQRTCTDTNQCNETYTKTENRTCESPKIPKDVDKEEPKKLSLYIFLIILLLILIILITKRDKLKELIKREQIKKLIRKFRK